MPMPRKPKTKCTPRKVLRLNDLDQAKRAVLNTLGSTSSVRAYSHAIDDFIDWYSSEPRLAFSRPVVLRYRIELESRQLSASTINLRLAAVRRLAYEAADNGLLSPELAAGIQRVKGAKRLGVRLGNWLTLDQCRTVLAAPDAQTTKGSRDRAILSLLIGCGLRRRGGQTGREGATATGEPLGSGRSDRQRKTCPHGSGPGVGEDHAR